MKKNQESGLWYWSDRKFQTFEGFLYSPQDRQKRNKNSWYFKTFYGEPFKNKTMKHGCDKLLLQDCSLVSYQDICLTSSTVIFLGTRTNNKYVLLCVIILY